MQFYNTSLQGMCLLFMYMQFYNTSPQGIKVKHNSCNNTEPVLSAVIGIPPTEMMMEHVYRILDMCQSYWTRSNLEYIQRSPKPRSEICVLRIFFIVFFGVLNFTPITQSESGGECSSSVYSVAVDDL